MPNSRSLVAVIDPSITEPSTICFNEMVATYSEPKFSLHFPALHGLRSLSEQTYQGVIILGSSAMVTDRAPWMDAVAEFAIRSFENGIPVFAICFGHQLIAQAMGGSVDYITPDRHKLEGVRSIALAADFLTKDGSAKRNSAPQSDHKNEVLLAVTHAQEVKRLPSALQAMGASPQIRYEAVRHQTQPYFGVQAHPEASRVFIREWIEGVPDELVNVAWHDGHEILGTFLAMLA